MSQDARTLQGCGCSEMVGRRGPRGVTRKEGAPWCDLIQLRHRKRDRSHSHRFPELRLRLGHPNPGGSQSLLPFHLLSLLRLPSCPSRSGRRPRILPALVRLTTEAEPVPAWGVLALSRVGTGWRTGPERPGARVQGTPGSYSPFPAACAHSEHRHQHSPCRGLSCAT